MRKAVLAPAPTASRQGARQCATGWRAACSARGAATRHRGITLVELTLSIALLSIIGYVVISLYPTSILSLKRSHDLLAATEIAQRHLEDMRAASFATVTSPTTSVEQVGGTAFTVVREAALETDPNVKHLTVTIRWNGGATQGTATIPMSRVFETSVARMTNL